ncbi:MAG: helix-turn-helix transcriptional regulator [Saprospiraceae bacterium]
MIDLHNDSSNFNLSENLRALRKRMKWSQEELAERLGLNRGNIASYESGTAEPKICNLVKFARLFNISIFDLTHSDLKEETNFIQATQRQSNGSGLPAIDQYAIEAKEFESAIKGLECIFNMKIRNSKELPEDMLFFKNQFEQLNNVARLILNSHVELIASIKSHCPEHQAKLREMEAKEFNA